MSCSQNHAFSIFRTVLRTRKGALAFVLVCSFLYKPMLRVLDKAEYSAFESMLNSSIVSYTRSRSQFFGPDTTRQAVNAI